MERKYGSDSEPDTSRSHTPRADDRFFTPRQSARVGGSSSDGEWGTPRGSSAAWASDGEYATPREHYASAYYDQQQHQHQHQHQHPAYHPAPAQHPSSQIAYDQHAAATYSQPRGESKPGGYDDKWSSYAPSPAEAKASVVNDYPHHPQVQPTGYPPHHHQQQHHHHPQPQSVYYQQPQPQPQQFPQHPVYSQRQPQPQPQPQARHYEQYYADANAHQQPAMSPIGVAPQRPPLYPQFSGGDSMYNGGSGGGGGGGGQPSYDPQQQRGQPQYYRPKQAYPGQPPDPHYGGDHAPRGGASYQPAVQQQHRQQAQGQEYYYAAHQPPGSGGYAYDSDAGMERGHAVAMTKDEPPPLSAGEAMDQAIDDIFSYARHNRVEEVSSARL
jgi:hypothetical protein